jgi:hypothetical protein
MVRRTLSLVVVLGLISLNARSQSPAPAPLTNNAVISSPAPAPAPAPNAAQPLAPLAPTGRIPTNAPSDVISAPARSYSNYAGAASTNLSGWYQNNSSNMLPYFSNWYATNRSFSQTNLPPGYTNRYGTNLPMAHTNAWPQFTNWLQTNTSSGHGVSNWLGTNASHVITNLNASNLESLFNNFRTNHQ